MPWLSLPKSFPLRTASLNANGKSADLGYDWGTGDVWTTLTLGLIPQIEWSNGAPAPCSFAGLPLI